MEKIAKMIYNLVISYKLNVLLGKIAKNNARYNTRVITYVEWLNINRGYEVTLKELKDKLK